MMIFRNRSETPNRQPQLISAFIGMQMFGWVAYTIILLTVMFSRNVRRHSSWINFCVSWTLSCISYSLLFLAGQQNSPEPAYELCLIQAALVYAAPPLTAGTTLALVIHLWFSVRSTVFKFSPDPKHERIRDLMLFISPYIPATAVYITVLILGLVHPSTVMPDASGLFCRIYYPQPGKLSAIYVTIIMVATLSIEVVISTALYRNWRSYTRNSKDSLAMVIRIAAFTIVGGLAIVICLVYVSEPLYGPIPGIFMALVPVSSVLIFGSQMDIIRAWMFWRPKPMPATPTRSYLRPLLVDTLKDSEESLLPPNESKEGDPLRPEIV